MALSNIRYVDSPIRSFDIDCTFRPQDKLEVLNIGREARIVFTMNSPRGVSVPYSDIDALCAMLQKIKKGTA